MNLRQLKIPSESATALTLYRALPLRANTRLRTNQSFRIDFALENFYRTQNKK